MHPTLALFDTTKLGLDWAIPLVLLGLALIFAEVFIPSGGSLTVLSVCSMIGSLVSAFAEGPVTGGIFIGVVVLGTPVVLAIAFKLFPHTPIGQRMIVSAEATTKDQRSAVAKDEKSLLGLVGQAKTMLRPAGSADIAGDVRDVVTMGEMIEAGTPVQVIEVEGNRIVVRAISRTA